MNYMFVMNKLGGVLGGTPQCKRLTSGLILQRSGSINPLLANTKF